MATLYITYHLNVGPNQVQAPEGDSGYDKLTISTEAHTNPVTSSCLAEMSCDAICNVATGKDVTVAATTGQRLPADTYGYFRWMNVGDRISVIANT